MTQHCIFKSNLSSTFSGLCSMFSVFFFCFKAGVEVLTGCCFCFASPWEPLMQTAPHRHKKRRLRALGSDVCGSICAALPTSHTRRDTERERAHAGQTRGPEEHTRTLTHTHKYKKNNADLGLFSWTHFITEKLWINNAFPELCLSKDLTKMERVINMTRVALSALKASVQWKGTWTQHTWRTTTKKKNKSLQGGQRKCVDPDTTRYIHGLIYPAHGGETAPCLFVWFCILCSGRVLMHGGNTSTEHSWGEGSKVMTKSYKNRKRTFPITRHRSWLFPHK